MKDKRSLEDLNFLFLKLKDRESDRCVTGFTQTAIEKTLELLDEKGWGECFESFDDVEYWLEIKLLNEGKEHLFDELNNSDFLDAILTINNEDARVTGFEFCHQGFYSKENFEEWANARLEDKIKEIEKEKRKGMH